MAEKVFDINIVSMRTIAGCCTVFLLQNDVIEIEWDIDLAQIQKQHLVQIKEIIGELGRGNKMRIYISTNPLLHSTNEAREFAASDEAQEFTFANAVLVNTAAKKILFNLYLKINKPKIPTKGFNNREDALAWLINL